MRPGTRATPRKQNGYDPEPASMQERARLTRELEQTGFAREIERFEVETPLERASGTTVNASHVSRTRGQAAQRRQPCSSPGRTPRRSRSCSREFVKPLRALTVELLRHQTLSGSEVGRIFAENTFRHERGGLNGT
jgi:hypothetical protein